MFQKRFRHYKTFSRNIAGRIKADAVGVMPTDTIYGLVGAALSRKSVSRLYRLRKRNPKKPFIILISSLADLETFKINLDERTTRLLKRMWPGRVSILLPAPGRDFFYIHRGTKQIAFRLPSGRKLRDFLRLTGPLAAPSANWEGHPPARNIREAYKYFGDKIDFYIDKGALKSLPSTLVAVENGRVEVKRQGAGKIKRTVLN